MSSARNPCPQVLFAGAFLAALLAPQACTAAGVESQTGAVSPEVRKMRSFAESQHEIVVILMRKKEFDQALSEANKIFALNWPPGQEAALRKDLLYFADQFLRQGQAALGIQLLDKNMKLFTDNADRAAVLKEKGYLHKNLGQDDKAIDCFREAQRLEKPDK